jgi:hypothetical protein
MVMIGVIGAGAYASEAAAGLPAPVIEVDRVVAVQVVEGWQFVDRADDGRTVYLTRGDGNMLIHVSEAGRSPEEALRALVDEEVAASGGVLYADPVETVTLDGGRTALRVVVRGSVSGIEYPVEGEFLALPTPSGRAVVFVGLAAAGDYHLVSGDVRRMIAEARLS